ncbi:aminoacyl tRNA synthase complex-interacting multifunctional protein 1-like [Xyrauchen texanus]|uniref:aminoacyl tRNA synthase complex-interacting multifunctional protein 1-like n=1 Tax=Xyrauchen texanus TaxID=154827 RepID=UPI002241B275|nr:aminoacyl tRNA synthase complex-interacting multifunctional protein 1-like [Xyrauchen texanus]
MEDTHSTQVRMSAKAPDDNDEEQMMEYFTQQVFLLKEKAMLQASVREEKKLLVENGKLKKDIDDLKKLLHDTQRRKAGTEFTNTPNHTTTSDMFTIKKE